MSLICKPQDIDFKILTTCTVQGGWGGWPTGNGKKVSNSQACCLAQLCLAAASFLSIFCGPSTPSTLYTSKQTPQTKHMYLMK